MGPDMPSSQQTLGLCQKEPQVPSNHGGYFSGKGSVKLCLAPTRHRQHPSLSCIAGSEFKEADLGHSGPQGLARSSTSKAGWLQEGKSPLDAFPGQRCLHNSEFVTSSGRSGCLRT